MFQTYDDTRDQLNIIEEALMIIKNDGMKGGKAFARRRKDSTEEAKRLAKHAVGDTKYSL
ncbi:hypothetical protein SK128_020914 [Halocaridina rubra]|uniref:Uncharacterized protein n=1 Tax=Halocaridina rubra TaxID=373956 RepID=A0AAN9AB41_HALRR